MPPTRLRNLYGINASGANVPSSLDSVLLMDGAITIGQLAVPLNNSLALVNAALTDNNAGQANAPDISINVAAAQTAVIPMVCSEYFKQVNAFLSTSSVPPVNNSGLLADTTGDTPVAKGCKVNAIEIAYSVQGGPLTTINLRADLVTFANGVANANTAMLANTELGVANRANTANATTCRVVTTPITAPFFDIADNTQMYIKISPVTPGGCTFRLYSVVLNITFNFN